MNGFGENFGGYGDFGNFKDMAEKFKEQKGKMGRGKKILLFVVIAVVLLLFFGGSILNLVMDVWQIDEIGKGFTDIFWKNFFCRLAVSGSGFLIVFIVSSVNLYVLRKLAFIKHTNISFLEKKWPYVLASALFSLLFGGIMGENSYVELLTALNTTSFGVTDPLFNQDISYYIFIRPFLETIVSSLKGVFLVQTILVALIYYCVLLASGIKSIKNMVQSERGALTHILANVIIYYVAMIFSYRLTAEGLMYQSFSNGIAGAGFIETNIWLNYYRIAPFIIIAAVILSVLCLYRKKIKMTVIFIAAVPVIYILVSVVSLLVNQFVVVPDERNYQSKYIEYNMNATKDAFGLKDIKEVQFDFNKPLTDEIIASNQNELLNTRITDFSSSLTAYNQLQYFRKYYTFNDIDVVPYEIDGELTGVFMSAREMNKDNMEESARSYTNEKFRYTHGFGVAASPFNKVTPDGQPSFVISDIPSKSKNGMPELTQPRIYYGESTNDYVIVGSKNKELDYSEGYTDIEYTYEGDSGVKLGFFKKLLFSLYYGDYKMFFSGNIDSESKILINRNVLERVKMVAPFFSYENDPCIVVDDNGEIKWVIDGFTTSDRYPYAQSYEGVNYIRNSVKVIVDAYTGNLKFYIIDPDDPVVNTYKKIYPSLFTDEPIPESLAGHLTVPESYFKVQSEVYQRYHISDAGQFYDQSDVWRVSTEKYHDNEITVEPYFNMFTVEGETEPELVLTIPYVLGDKYNMVGILMMRSNKEHYGELVLYRIPKSDTVYGPMQIENKIDNDPDISREMTLWGQGGSTVIRGNLLVIPFENSIFYVEPVYITSQNNASLPEAKRIIVAYKDEVAMEPTLEEAIAKVLKTSDGIAGDVLTENAEPEAQDTESVPEIPDASEATDKIQNVLDAYEALKSEWDKMGEELNELEKVINALK